MRILHIAQYAGPRVYKQMLAQQDAGWDVTLMAMQTGQPALHQKLRKAIGWQSHACQLELTKIYDVAVVHTTIATDAFAAHLPQLARFKRMVWDCHDLVQTDAASLYDAVIVPSEGYAKLFEGKAKQVEVVYSKVPKTLWPAKKTELVQGVVLNATLHPEEPWGDYSSLPAELAPAPLFVYPSSQEVGEKHQGLRLMRTLPYEDLLHALTAYERNYAGSANPGVEIDVCCTNKLWDGIAAGLPQMCNRAAEHQAIVDFIGLPNERGKMREFVKQHKHVLSMEYELPKALSAYKG